VHDVHSFGRGNWFDAVGREHRAARERVALFDQSSFAKFEMRGRDADKALSWIAANDVTKAPGRLVYTQMLNSRGGIECDLTVARLAPDHYYIVTGTGFRTHDFAWIRQNIPAGLDATLTDVTEQFGTLSLMGPRARDVLAKVTDADLSNLAFPFATLREIDIAGVTVCALRITYVGELGWELHMPIDDTGKVFDRLMEAGGPFGIAPAGYRAIESLRLEKGYRAWGSDITPNDNPFQASLGWAVKLKSDRPFLGRGATEKIANSPLTKRLMTFTVEDPSIVLAGRETVLRDGKPVGYLTSAGWGYTTAENIGFGYVRNPDGVSDDFLRSGRYELEVATERVPATLHRDALYDPANARVKS
jgi:sarcosine dehydrogenase